jgi:hypothetical protein
MSRILLAAAAVLTFSSALANAQGTAFTYQGRLSINDQPANGVYRFTFSAFDARTGGTQFGQTLTQNAVAVKDGLFVVILNFGSVFSGGNFWLEIGVRTNTLGEFTILSPRQRLTATPYAITAGNLTGVLPAGQLSGTVSFAQLPGTIVTNNQSGVAFAGAFSGSGSGLTNVSAVTAVTATSLQGLGDQQFFRTNGLGASSGSFYRDWTRRGNSTGYNLNNDGARTVFATTNELWAANYVMLTNFPGVEGSCVFVSRSNNVNVPALYWTFTNVDNIRGVDVEVLWVTNGANSTAPGYSRSLNISFSEWPTLSDPADSNLFRLSGRNGAHFNYHADGVQLHFFTNTWYVAYTDEDYLGRHWVDTWTGRQPDLATFKPQHGSVWHCGFEFMSPTTMRVYSGPNEYVRSLDFLANFNNVHSFWLESMPRDQTNLSITACIRSVTVFTHQKSVWPRWWYMTTNGMVLTKTTVTN